MGLTARGSRDRETVHEAAGQPETTCFSFLRKSCPCPQPRFWAAWSCEAAGGRGARPSPTASPPWISG